MNTLISIFLILAACIGLLLLIGLFSSKSYSILRTVVINKSTQEVFNYIRHIKNQDFYNKWVMMDLNMKKSYRGTDGTVGFVYAWNGNSKAGEGEQEIMGIIENEKLDLEVRFVRPFEAIAKTPITIQSESASQTKLTWGMSSSMKYPMNIMLLFMNMDKMLGKDLEASLVTLKGILEKD